MSRPRHWPAAILTLLLALLTALPARAEITVTDIMGRTVTIEAPARRIVLGEGRHMSVLGLLHDDPVALVAGWRLARPMDPATEAAYRTRFPAIGDLAVVGSSGDDLSAESVIALQPDLVVLSLMDGSSPGLTRAREQIEAAGIPVVFVDFFTNPQKNTLPSLAILGQLTGAEARAAEFAAFYQTRIDRIRARLEAANPPRPRVFVQVHAGPKDCCATVGSGVFNDFVTTAGGTNIGAEVVGSVQGKVSLEYLLTADPDIYLATGGQHMAARGGLVIGAGVPEAEARASFDALIGAPGLSSLRAVEEGRAIGVWHLFNDSPINIALIEYLAQRFHPDLFADLDPAGTLREIEARFSPVAVEGTWWLASGD